MTYLSEINTVFWPEVYIFKGFETYGEWIDYLSTFDGHCDIMQRHIANFSDRDLYEIETYLTDIVTESSGRYEKIFNRVLQFMMGLQKLQIELHTETYKEHEYIVKRISKKYTKNDMGQKIHCPIDEYILSKNFIELNEQDSNDPYVILWELRKQTRVYHYYIMMYVHDLSLKLHSLRKELIKYDLARSGKISGTPLDIIINEKILCYMEINNELRNYSKKMKEFCYNSNHSCMYPENYYMSNPIYFMV